MSYGTDYDHLTEAVQEAKSPEQMAHTAGRLAMHRVQVLPGATTMHKDLLLWKEIAVKHVNDLIAAGERPAMIPTKAATLALADMGFVTESVNEQEIIPAEFIDDDLYHTFEISVEAVDVMTVIEITPPLPTPELRDGVLNAVKKVRGVHNHTVKWQDDEALEAWININKSSDIDRINEDIDNAVVKYLDDAAHEGQD